MVFGPEKFAFARRASDFAGFRVTESTIEPLPKYIDAIRDFQIHPLSQTSEAGLAWSIKYPTMPN